MLQKTSFEVKKLSKDERTDYTEKYEKAYL